MWFYDEESGDYFFVGALHWRVTVVDLIPMKRGVKRMLFYLINDNTFKAVPLIAAGRLYSALDIAGEIVERREGFA